MKWKNPIICLKSASFLFVGYIYSCAPIYIFDQVVQCCLWIGWVKLEWGKLNYIANKMLVSLESLKTSTNSCVTKFYQLPNGASGLSPSGIVGSEGGGKLVGKPPLLITRDTTCPQIIESCPIFTFKKSLFGSPLFKSLQLCNFEPLTWDEKR